MRRALVADDRTTWPIHPAGARVALRPHAADVGDPAAAGSVVRGVVVAYGPRAADAGSWLERVVYVQGPVVVVTHAEGPLWIVDESQVLAVLGTP